MKLVDTDVPGYAPGREHPRRTACRRLLAWAAEHPGELTTDAEVRQEVLHLHVTRGDVGKGAAAVGEFLSVLPRPFPIGAGEVQEAATLLLHHRRLSTRGAVHAAVVRLQGLEAIVSVDRDFDEIPGLRRLDPEEAVP